MRGKDLRMECRKLINKKKNLTLLNDLVNKLQNIIKKRQESQNVKEISVNLDSLNVQFPKDVKGREIKLDVYVIFIARKLKLNVGVKDEEKRIITIYFDKITLKQQLDAAFSIFVTCFSLVSIVFVISEICWRCWHSISGSNKLSHSLPLLITFMSAFYLICLFVYYDHIRIWRCKKRFFGNVK